MDGIAEDEARGAGDRSRREQLLGPLFSVLGHPPVDGRARSLRGTHEVDDVSSSTVIVRQGGEEGDGEGIALLTPQSVGDGEMESFAGGAFGPLAVVRKCAMDCVERGMDLALGKVEVEGSGHLLFGRPTRASPGHGERFRDAERGEEEVPRAGSELTVEVDGEGGVSVNDGLNLGRGDRIRLHALRRGGNYVILGVGAGILTGRGRGGRRAAAGGQRGESNRER